MAIIIPLYRFSFTILLLCSISRIQCQSLNLMLSLQSSAPQLEHLKYYQFIQFSNKPLDNIQAGQSIHIQFDAFNATFKLSLKTDSKVFINEANVDKESETGLFGQFDRFRLVSGTLQDDDHSYAYGYVDEMSSYHGVFYTNQTVYYVEWIGLYANQWSDEQQYFIYRDIDIGSQKSVINTNDGNNQQTASSTSTSSINQNNQITSLLMNDTTCLAHIDIDRTFLQHYHNNFAYVISDVAILVQRVNHLYRRTDFDQDGKADGIGIAIKNLTFGLSDELIGINLNSTTISTTVTTTSNILSKINNPVEFFNRLTVAKNYSDSCLALYLTGQKFDKDVLGMANSGFKANEGICTGYYINQDHHVASSNVAVVSINDRNHVIPFATREIAIAHEIGHLFGSLHDTNGSSCSPNNHQGNYVMYEKLVDGSKRNNFHFSTCSRSEIKQNLILKIDQLRPCLTQAYYPLCGNGIIDEGEECDCGYQSTCKDPCCNSAYQYLTDIPSLSQVGYNYIPCRKNSQATCGNAVVPIEAIGISVTFGLPIILVIVLLIYKQVKHKFYMPIYGEAGTGGEISMLQNL
ncbi:uncharacterized protein TRIADDRAFT_51549 [Trichoplax adhaerens]|uniref:Peptidase M12B domain-containing protein n=1 Tax=Trichoplax adhaerens TaxID=10228 RepID=B3RJQ5_TRIAD|nr:hypothetical protein TRIADDRAFT_51549 [Trichoplax adhaerens]EDV28540.1 hypothetical protein TRIADDRAFT_51549 [Trichoplax adhaerens]|eukprot:XP_002107742.1 hypothetical protein TRIADDRAFT_51549 [Trichoplax adhaerens]